MKKLYFGFVLIIAGALLIGSIFIAGAINNMGSFGSILSTNEINTLFTFSLIIFIAGLTISAIEALKKDK